MKALVLIKFASHESKDTYYQLSRLEAVMNSYMVYGRYDAALTLQGRDLEEIHDIILSEIQPVTGVMEILPCIVVENDAPAVDHKRQPQQSSV